MVKKKKIKILILAGLVVLLLGIISAVAYFGARSHSHVQALHDGLEAFDNKDYDKAIIELSKVLKADKDNETATAKLGEIYEICNNWTLAAYYYLQATRLNTLESSYEQHFIYNVLRGRFFARVTAVYNDPKHKALTLEEQLLVVYATLMTGNVRVGIEKWQKLSTEHPEVAEMPYGKLIITTYFSRNETIETILSRLDELVKNENPCISQEALIALANVNGILKQYASQEENLKKVMEINYYVGAPMLGQFYSNHNLFPQAAEIFEQYLPKYKNTRIAMLLGEMYLYTSQTEKLKNMSKRWKRRRGKENITTAYFLDAIYAFANKDYASVREIFTPIRGVINTPLAAFMAIISDIQGNDTLSLENDLQAFVKFPPFLDFRQKVHAIVMLYIQERIQAGTDVKELAKIADILENANLSDEPDQRIATINLIGKFRDGSLTKKELDAYLDALPQDQSTLEVAVGFHCSHDDYIKAWELFTRLEKLENVSMTENTNKLGIHILIKLEKFSEAQERFRNLLQTNPSHENYLDYFFLGFNFNQPSALKDIVDLKEDPQSLPGLKICAQASMLILNGKQEEAISKFDSFESSEGTLLYFAAVQVAQGKQTDKALALLNRIPKEFDSYLQVLALQTELLLNKDDLTQATAKAKEAQALDQTSPLAKQAMAACCRKSGDWKKAQELANPSLWEKSGNVKLREIWFWSMEMSAKAEFDAKRYASAKRICNQMQIFDKENAAASELISKIDEILEKEKQEKQKQQEKKNGQ